MENHGKHGKLWKIISVFKQYKNHLKINNTKPYKKYQ